MNYQQAAEQNNRTAARSLLAERETSSSFAKAMAGHGRRHLMERDFAVLTDAISVIRISLQRFSRRSYSV